MSNRTAFFVIVVALISSCAERAPGGDSALDPHPSRVRVNAQVAAEVSSVSDFVVFGKNLYVLDWREHRVAELVSVDGLWRAVRFFSRPGQGPGEIKDPVALAFNDSTRLLEILERSGEIESFDTAGTYAKSGRVELPCPSVRIQLAIEHGQRFVGQRCLGIYARSLPDDSLYMILAEVFANRQPELLLHQATSSKDGSWGSIYTATWPFAIAGNQVLFGGGVTTCTYHALISQMRAARSSCNGQALRYSASRPPDFTNPSKQRSADWPRPLPYFAGSVSTGSSWLLARFVSGDSIAFEPLREARRLLLVAPLNSFVGCKNTRCLWYDDDERGGRLELVEWARR